MSLIDDPKAWILRLFEMEENEGRGENCQKFPSGTSPTDIFLLPDELVYGIFKEKYYFTPISFIQKTKSGYEKIGWNEIKNCSSSHGEGKKYADLTLVDGRIIRVRVGDFAVGWSGRISQLFHQMIQKYGAKATLGPEPMSIEAFFKVADDNYCFAPNLEPHPTLAELKEAFLELKNTEGIHTVLINIIEIEENVPISDGLIVITDTFAPENVLQKFSTKWGADGVIDANENVTKAFSMDSNKRVKMIIWD